MNISRKEWVERCANRYIEVAGLDVYDAYSCALQYWEEIGHESNPEEAADEDMSYWSN